MAMCCMCSSPPTICTSSPPAMIAWAAWLMACKLEPQSRLTVVPAAELGRPAISATGRATLKPCSPCCCVLPSTTSSISAGSMPLRSTSASDDGHGQIVAADVAKDAFFFMRPADGSSQAIDDHGTF